MSSKEGFIIKHLPEKESYTFEQGLESGDEDGASNPDNADPDPVEHDEEQQHPGSSQSGRKRQQSLLCEEPDDHVLEKKGMETLCWILRN